MRGFLDKPVFESLRDPDYFRRVRVVDGSVSWPDEQDLYCGAVYERGEALSPAAG